MKRTHQISQELIRFLPRTRENAMPFVSVMHYLNIGEFDFEDNHVKSTLDRFSENPKSDLMKCITTKSYYLDLKGRNDGYNLNPIIPKHGELKIKVQRIEDFPKRTKDIIFLYNSGKSLQEIGDNYGLSRERIRQILLPAEALGLVDKKRERVPDKRTIMAQKLRGMERKLKRLQTVPKPSNTKNHERNTLIEKFVREGLSYSQIALKVGVSRSTVCAVMYRQGQRILTSKRNSDILQDLLLKKTKLK